MFTQCSVQDNIIQSLDNKPIDGGLTPDQLKDKFDEGYEGIKNYINNTLLPELFCPASIINGNFRYPVNQYGRTSGAAFSTSDTYFVDMWKLVSGSVTWAAGTGFSLNGVLKQYFEVVPTDLYDEKLPVSINVGGTDYVKLMTFPSNTTDTDTETAGAVTITVGYEEKSSNLCGVAVTHVPYISLTTSSAVTIKYVYSVTPPANYEEQLRKCQRYLKDLAGIYRMAYASTDMISFATEATGNGMRLSVLSILVIGSEQLDWRVATVPSGSYVTGFTLGLDPNGWGTLTATKTSHGLTDAILAIKPGKVFVSAEL